MSAKDAHDSPASRLWDKIGRLFSDGDGSLPEVQFKGVSVGGGERIYRALLERADPLRDCQTAWSSEQDVDVPLPGLAEPVAQVAAGRLANIHVVLTNVTFEHRHIPDLGVGVFPGEILLDYRMGEGWDPDVLAAFVRLLATLHGLDPASRIVYWDATLRETRQRFAAAVNEYLAEVTLRPGNTAASE